MYNGKRINVHSPGIASGAPKEVPAFGVEVERAVITTLITEVNDLYGLSLAIPRFERSCATTVIGGTDMLGAVLEPTPSMRCKTPIFKHPQ